VLDSLGLSVGSLNRCVITHNHPDHIGGIFEYVTARHVAGERTWLYGSRSVTAMMAGLAGLNLEVSEFASETIDIIPPYEAMDGTRRITATPLATSHRGAGPIEGSCGVAAASEKLLENGQYSTSSTCVILGDTEYHSDSSHPNVEVFDRIRTALSRSNLRVAVLHIGCSQLKAHTGKHLYLPGLKDILKDIDNFRRRHVQGARERKLLVLISEWGLEHATVEQLTAALPNSSTDDPRIQALKKQFGPENVIMKTLEVLQSICQLETITLLPADIGLIVGIESGKVYLDGVPVQPEEVEVISEGKGLGYLRRGGQKRATNT
jgi:hypothetical protein